MTVRLLEKTGLEDLIESFSSDYQVFGPVERRFDVAFERVSSFERMKLDYTTTTLPPKNLFHCREVLFEYDEGKLKTPRILPEKPILIFGIHSCDLNALLRLDEFFAGENADPYYLRRRQGSVLIALSCLEAGENCFCASLGTGPTPTEGFDLLLTDLGDRYLVEVGTEKGRALIEGSALREASSEDLSDKRSGIEEALSSFEKHLDMRGLAERASADLEHEVWTLIGERGGLAGCFPCLSCGNCSLVCPTCYCYEVEDVSDLSLKGGMRSRRLDSCQLLGYAEVALGGNFRRDRRHRIRHWMTCKFGGAAGGGHSSCVGCGRCIGACPAHIDLTEVAKSLRGERVG